MKDAALKLAAEGLPVFPVGPDKKPRTANGFHDATVELDDIGAEADGWPGLAVAIPEGIVVIDVDPRNGGDATVEALKAAGRSLPRTRTTSTQSGGKHYWLTVPEGVKLRTTLGPGVDVKRAGKGYVVVPPTKGYRWVPGHDKVEPAPQWLLDELVTTERSTPAGGTPAGGDKFFQWEDGTAYGLRAMEGELGRLLMVREGGRNDALNKAAFALAQLAAGGELSETRATEELLIAAERIGLTRSEAEATIASGWAAGEQEPRQSPVQELGAPLAVATPGATGELDTEPRWADWNVDEPPPPFYIWPLLPKHAYVLVYGSTEASKSMVWAAGICSQASHEGHRCTVYSLENPPHTDRDRLRRWAPDPANYRLTNDPLDLNDPRQLAGLVEREKDWGDGRGTDIIIIDTYSHAFNSRSEDGNAKAIDFARRVRWVMHEVGCSVIVIDHTGYEGDEPRDASAKRQQVDVAILMKKEGVWAPGQDAQFTMENRKAARFGNPFFIRGAITDTHKDGVKGLGLRWLTADAPEWRQE